MKKKIIAVIILICIAAVLIPMTSRAAMPPYFMAVNDTLLPFNETTSPYIYGGNILVPHTMFGEAQVWSAASAELERVRMYRGAGKHVDLYTARGIAEDQDGNTLAWPASRRIGSRFYVPLQQVCEFFELTFEILEVSRDIIPQEQMFIIRIISKQGLNGPSFIGINRDALKNAYNDYYTPSPLTSPSSPATSPATPTASSSTGESLTPTPDEETPPTYNDVTIYHCFYNISAGGAGIVMDLLEANAASDYRFCFFVSVGDIIKEPGLIRRISASGQMIGIWLEDGTYSEYVRTSSLLFESAKIRTVLVSAGKNTESAPGMADEHGLMFWGLSQGLVYDDTLSVDAVTEMITKESGAQQNLFASCSENAALMLSGILAYLRGNEYTTAWVNETTEPVENSEFGIQNSE